MPIREDLAYEEREMRTPYIYTGASDVDEALEKAYEAILDARNFRGYARATGTDVVKRDLSIAMAAGFFAVGALVCLLALWCLEVI